ncbi:MAG: DHA2 family efflux MFS transporter permease subunit, partial [Candidatus Rokubacteria bacterium]|nr:DHA2 family efflux MFS transporter permease subunit [Candidatus Rokubacteria bacterium]
FTLSSVAAGAAPTLELLIIARVLQGLGGGSLIPLSQAIVMETFPPKEQGMAMAVWGVGIMVAPILGPLLGGWITDNWSWRWIFYIKAPLGPVAILLGYLFIQDPPGLRREITRVDWRGLGLLAVGIGALQVVLDRGQREDWFSSRLIVSLSILALAALASFVVRELTTAEPILDLRVLRHRTFAVGTGLVVLMSAALYGAVVLSPLYTQLVMGYTPLWAGLVLAPGGLATMITMPLAGALINRIDPRWILGTGAAVGALAMAMMATLTLEADFWRIMWPRFIQGLGIGFMFVPLSTVTLGAVERQELGHASSLYNVMRNLGGSLGIAVMSTFLERGAQVHQVRLVAHVSAYDPETWQRAQMLAAGFVARGADSHTAQLQVWGALYEVVQRQALFLSFLDDFWRLAWMFLFLIPFLLLMRRPRSAPARP